MTIKIYCKCGAEIGNEIPAYDKKTRTLDWFEKHGPQCASCAARDGEQAGKSSEATDRFSRLLDLVLMH